MAADGGDGTVYGGFGGVLLLNQRTPSSQHLDSCFNFGSSSNLIGGSNSMVSFEGGKRSERLLLFNTNTYDDQEDNNNGGEEEEFVDYFHQPEKKRRLKMEQVRFLEKSFECEDKLEPERKVELAKEVGLQPRQVAIWFQNRRARWKTKQMEKDFDILQASYDTLKDDYANLLKEKATLQAEVIDLTEKLEKEQGDHSELPNTHTEEAMIDSASDSEKHNSAKNYSLTDQPIDSSNAFEATDHSDISQDDEDYLSTSLLPFSSHSLSKVEDIDYPPSNSCNFELTAEEDHDHASLFWPYWDINLKM